MSTPPSTPPPPLLSLRTAVILVLALVLGLMTGALTYFAGQSVAAAVLAGLAASGATIPVLHLLLGH